MIHLKDRVHLALGPYSIRRKLSPTTYFSQKGQILSIWPLLLRTGIRTWVRIRTRTNSILWLRHYRRPSSSVCLARSWKSIVVMIFMNVLISIRLAINADNPRMRSLRVIEIKLNFRWPFDKVLLYFHTYLRQRVSWQVLNNVIN